MVKIQNVSEITLFEALQNLIFWKNIALMEVSLADFIPCFCLSVQQKLWVCWSSVWGAGTYSLFPHVLMVLKAYTRFSDRQLVKHLNGNIHYQMFCGIMIDLFFPITDYKIVSAIRKEIVSSLDIDSLQKVLTLHWKTYLENFHVCKTDATCYESHMSFTIGMKLL